MAGPRGGGRRGGVGIGGGFGGGRSGRGQDAGGRAEARAESERVVALAQELVTPTARWLIALEGSEALALTSADGRTARYVPNNKTEKHQLTNGTIETKSRWVGNDLRQEIRAADGIEMVRQFAVDTTTGQLIVTTTFSGGRGQDRPFRVVYDRDEN